MTITRFPHGVSSFGIPVIGSGEIVTTGSVFFVDSGHSSASDSNAGTDPSQPKATLAGALSAATASAGDWIILAEGHAETLTAALAVNKAGVTIMGLGNGDNRPTFTGTATTDDFNVTAANVRISNIKFLHTTANGTGMINVNADDVTIDNCHFEQGANALFGITVVSGKSGTLICDNYFEVTANGPDVAIDLEKSTTTGPAKTRILRNHFNGMSATNSWDLGVIESDAVCTNIEIAHNVVQFVIASKGGIELSAASTGIIHYNVVAGATFADLIDPGSCYCIRNYIHDTGGETETGAIFPATTAS